MLAEILSRLPIKSLMRFKCLSKYFQSFISDPRLGKMHLQKSPKTPNFLLSYRIEGKKISYLVPSPISSLIEDSQHKRSCIVDIIKGSKPHRKKDRVLGSCNGLVCLDLSFSVC
ncbi:hypothetical protein V8G54_018168 [Vigna mungo]|uniref:F-box domain-containing protein n=1 Tax=Vigna mungo TaxID=3915 RepID=A0AAQ3N953_VIGMU